VVVKGTDCRVDFIVRNGEFTASAASSDSGVTVPSASNVLTAPKFSNGDVVTVEVSGLALSLGGWAH
jgi:hypothetical protein